MRALFHGLPPLFLALALGCEYDAPVTTEHTLPIDPVVLGLWEPPRDDGASDPSARMLILRFSDTEYAVHYPTSDSGLYYRAYPIKVGEVSCVQLEVLGSREKVLKPEDKERFQVVSYAVTDGRLAIRVLNSDLLGHSVKDSASLRAALLKHQNDPNLFNDPEVFSRVSGK